VLEQIEAVTRPEESWTMVYTVPNILISISISRLAHSCLCAVMIFRFRVGLT
jgi:hypothetical protein